MAKPCGSILEWVYNHFKNDASKMLIWTGVAGWTLSSLAQVCAIVFNGKISKEKKSYLVPQETADAAVNIALFFLFTQASKKMVAKLFTTGKIAPKAVREFLNKNKNLYKDKVGKIDFNLDTVKKEAKDFPTDNYHICKNYGTALATVAAGVISSNIITPIVRNNMASRMHKNYLNYIEKQGEIKPIERKPLPNSIYKSSDLKI